MTKSTKTLLALINEDHETIQRIREDLKGALDANMAIDLQIENLVKEIREYRRERLRDDFEKPTRADGLY